MYDLESMTELYRISSADGRRVCFHPNGDRFLVVGPLGSKIYAADDGRELISLPRIQQPASFSADGRTLYARIASQQMIILESDDWTIPDKGTDNRMRLARVNKLLEKPAG